MLLPEHDGSSEDDSREEGLVAPVVAGCDPSPVFQPAEHVLDPVASFVAALVVRDGLATRLPAGMQGFVLLSLNASLNRSTS